MWHFLGDGRAQVCGLSGVHAAVRAGAAGGPQARQAGQDPDGDHDVPLQLPRLQVCFLLFCVGAVKPLRKPCFFDVEALIAMPLYPLCLNPSLVLIARYLLCCACVSCVLQIQPARD